MNNYMCLTKIMMKNETMQSPNSKNKKLLIGILGFFAVICIFIPACVLVGAISFIMTTAVKEAGGDIQGACFVLLFISGFSIVFGLSVILNVFYFSNDMNYLLPLPLQPWEIIASKFTVAFINESVMEFLIIISAIVGYSLATNVSIIGIIVGAFGMITIPILPLVYCGIISVILMTFTGVVKNKDSVHKLMGIATALLVVVAFISVSAVGGLNIDNYARSLVDGNNGIYNILNMMFIHVGLLCKAINGDLVSLLLYIVVNVLAIAVFLLLAQRFYFTGVIGLVASGRRNNVELKKLLDKNVKQRSESISYLKKEMLMLVRTPAFLMNCVLINFLWPALLYAVYMLQGSSELFSQLIKDYRNHNDKMMVYVPVAVIVISILVTAANAIASSAVTREGTGFVFMKYIPMSVKKQLFIKSMVSIIISGFCVSLYIIVACVAFKVSVLTCVFYIVTALTGVVFVTFLGVTLDTVNPKLLWDDEINALRGNSTVFFSMAYAMMLGVLLVGFSFVLLEMTKFSPVVINGIIVAFMLILDVVTYVNCMNMGQDNLDL